MTAAKYLKTRLEKLVSSFPSGAFAYEFDKFSGIHIVHVRPLALYEIDNTYKELEAKLSFDFDNLFYPESLLFISDNSLNSVSNPEFEIKGIFYGLQPMVNISSTPGFIQTHHDEFVAGENNYALAA